MQSFGPKPPPTSGVITRSFDSSKSSSEVIDWNRSCAFWVEAQTVMPSVPRWIFGEDAAAFDRMAGAAVLPEIGVEHMRGLGEGGVGVAEIHLVGGDGVGVELAPHRRRAGRDRLAAIGDRRAAGRSRRRPARRRPRRCSGCRRSRWRPARRHRTPRRRRARSTTCGRAACRNWSAASCGAWPSPARGRRA